MRRNSLSRNSFRNVFAIVLIAGSLGTTSPMTNPASAAPSQQCVAVPKAKKVCKPAIPAVKVVADYWGYSAYISLPKSSSKADSYLYSFNAGKTWLPTTDPYVYVTATSTKKVGVQVKAKNVAGLSPVAIANGKALVNDTCPQKVNCVRLPISAAFIKVQSVISLVVGKSITLQVHSNVEPEFDTTGGCDIDAKTLKITTTNVGPCEIYAFGYGDGVISQGFAHGNLIVFVTKAGSTQGSNAPKPNDFACTKPAKTQGKAPSAAFAQVLAVGKTAISLHVGYPKNTGSTPVTCFDYSFDNGKSWMYGAESAGPLTFYVRNLSKGKTYSLRVRAMNKGGYGPASAVVNVTTNR